MNRFSNPPGHVKLLAMIPMLTLAGLAPAQGIDWSLRAASPDQPQALELPQTVSSESLAEDTPPIAYGLQGGTWLTLGTGIASDIDNAEDAYVFAQYSKFIADDFEWAIELGGWALDPPGDYTPGFSVSSIFRWHYYRNETWTAFADLGVGLLIAGHKVPSDGTNFNFLPRVGIGGTYRLNNSNTRLIGGLRWHHISNARIIGNDSNPGRDAVMLYVGISMPF